MKEFELIKRDALGRVAYLEQKVFDLIIEKNKYKNGLENVSEYLGDCTRQCFEVQKAKQIADNALKEQSGTDAPKKV